MESIPKGTYKGIDARHGDSREVLKTLADCSVDSCVTDPPYSLQTINKRFAKVGRNDKTWSSSGPHQRTARGFMNQSWDTGDTAHDPEFWAEVYRVLKPGAHCVAFGGTRTHHRLVCAIEDAGFEIRDTIGFLWCFATGFPKSHDVSRGIDRELGADREVIGKRDPRGTYDGRERPSAAINRNWRAAEGRDDLRDLSQQAITEPATDAARQWSGWGTALKPAFEPIVLARKPLSEPTIAANVLKWGTGALNIDGCRIETSDDMGDPSRFDGQKKHSADGWSRPHHHDDALLAERQAAAMARAKSMGRWPANLVHDGSDEVVALFPESGGQQGDVRGTEPSPLTDAVYGERQRVPFNKRGGEASAERRYTEEGATNFAAMPGERRSDAGSAARFFFSAPHDIICSLCKHIIAPSAAHSSSTVGTTDQGTNLSAPSDALDCTQPGLEGNVRPLTNDASHAASPLEQCPPKRGGIAPSLAERSGREKLVINVMSAGTLCNCCATAIAQELAEAGRCENVGKFVSQLCIDSSSKTILIRSLVRYVAGRGNTDIILTTESLKELFGSVFYAIAESINSERREANGNDAPKRLWFSGKADRHDRWGSKHPTVKPIALIRWLIRLVTPPGGTILDPFAGSGTAGVAALAEGVGAILIEREAAYHADILARMAFYAGGGRHSVSAKARSSVPRGTLPLFGEETGT